MKFVLENTLNEKEKYTIEFDSNNAEYLFVSGNMDIKFTVNRRKGIHLYSYKFEIPEIDLPPYEERENYNSHPKVLEFKDYLEKIRGNINIPINPIILFELDKDGNWINHLTNNPKIESFQDVSKIIFATELFNDIFKFSCIGCGLACLKNGPEIEFDKMISLSGIYNTPTEPLMRWSQENNCFERASLNNDTIYIYVTMPTVTKDLIEDMITNYMKKKETYDILLSFVIQRLKASKYQKGFELNFEQIVNIVFANSQDIYQILKEIKADNVHKLVIPFSKEFTGKMINLFAANNLDYVDTVLKLVDNPIWSALICSNLTHLIEDESYPINKKEELLPIQKSLLNTLFKFVTQSEMNYNYVIIEFIASALCKSNNTFQIEQYLAYILRKYTIFSLDHSTLLYISDKFSHHFDEICTRHRTILCCLEEYNNSKIEQIPLQLALFYGNYFGKNISSHLSEDTFQIIFKMFKFYPNEFAQIVKKYNISIPFHVS